MIISLRLEWQYELYSNYFLEEGEEREIERYRKRDRDKGRDRCIERQGNQRRERKGERGFLLGNEFFRVMILYFLVLSFVRNEFCFNLWYFVIVR